MGVGVTNYFYNTSMGDNWGSTAATLGNLTVNASSKTGTAAAVDASYNTEGSVQNDVILQVTGNANLTATTESGEAIGVNVSGPTKVEFDGNLTASASVSGEGGTAYSVKADKGTLTLNGAQNNLIGDVGISNSGTIALGDASKTTVDGNITAVKLLRFGLHGKHAHLTAGVSQSALFTLYSAAVHNKTNAIITLLQTQ